MLCPAWLIRLANFVAEYRKLGKVPLPEDGKDMVIAGGPPCQDVRKPAAAAAAAAVLLPYAEIMGMLHTYMH